MKGYVPIPKWKFAALQYRTASKGRPKTALLALKLLFSRKPINDEETLNGREGGLIFGENFFPGETAVLVDESTPNNLATTSEAMWNKLGGRNAPVGEAFTLDASNSRLRELVFGYSLRQATLANTPFTHVDISLVGRNLFFFSNAAETADSEQIVNTATNADGWEAFGLPPVREFGVNLKFGF